MAKVKFEGIGTIERSEYFKPYVRQIILNGGAKDPCPKGKQRSFCFNLYTANGERVGIVGRLYETSAGHLAAQVSFDIPLTKYDLGWIDAGEDDDITASLVRDLTDFLNTKAVRLQKENNGEKNI